MAAKVALAGAGMERVAFGRDGGQESPHTFGAVKQPSDAGSNTTHNVQQEQRTATAARLTKTRGGLPSGEPVG
jgi:hypothetical protein